MNNNNKQIRHESYSLLQSTMTDWEHIDLHLDELMEKEDWSSIVEYVADNERLLLSRWMAEGRESLDKSLKVGNVCMTLVSNMLSLEEKLNSVFKIGSLYGMLQLLDKQITYEKEELYSVQIAEKALSSVKNLDEIVLLLEQNGTLTHSALAQKLGNMNPPTLTDNMRKVIDRGLVYSHTYGRFKQYYLTDTGRIYARNLRKRRNTSIDLERVENILETWLKDSTKTESVQEMLNRLWNPKENTKQKEFQRTALSSKSDNAWYWSWPVRELEEPAGIGMPLRRLKPRTSTSENVKNVKLVEFYLDRLEGADNGGKLFSSANLEQINSVNGGILGASYKKKGLKDDMFKKISPIPMYS